MDALTISAIIGGISSLLVPAIAKAYIEIMKAKQAQRIIMENGDLLDSDDPETAARAKKAMREYKQKHAKKKDGDNSPPPASPTSTGAAIVLAIGLGLSLSSCATTQSHVTKETVYRDSTGDIEWVSIEFPKEFPSDRDSYEFFIIDGHPHVFVVNTPSLEQ